MTDFEIASLTRFGDAPFFVFCDHASNHLPADLNRLGIPDDVLQTHVAWDIGAGALSSALAERLQGTVFACGFSRLVVDANRALTASDLIPAISDLIPIPGNQMLTEAERRRRIDQFHTPYHERLSTALDAMHAQYGGPFVISVHSFTNRLMGAAEERPWKIGLLWREDEKSARAALRRLERETGWSVGDNEPYDAREFNYSVDRHIGSRSLRHVTFEVRQDQLGDGPGVERIADLLAAGVRQAARDAENP